MLRLSTLAKSRVAKLTGGHGPSFPYHKVFTTENNDSIESVIVETDIPEKEILEYNV